MSRPGVLVTRPAEQAGGLAKALQSTGYAPILAPCLECRLIDGPPLDLAGVSAVAVTSANGVVALARRTLARDIRLIAVGAATADAARRAGFERVEIAGGDGLALAAHIAALIDPAMGRIVHISANEAAFDLAAGLDARGYRTERIVGYDMQPTSVLPSKAITALTQGEAAAVLLMSARTAATFVDLTRPLRPLLASLAAIALSEAVASVARGLGCRLTAVAAAPTQAALLDSLAAVVPAHHDFRGAAP